jgi:carboxypeptidase Taq
MAGEWGGVLADHMRQIAALRQVEMVLGWDRETQMPPKGAAQRAEQAAAVAGALHRLETDPRLGDWLDAAAKTAEDRAAVNVAEAARVHRRATRVPARLTAELARAGVEGQTIWAEARAASDFGAFAPALARIVALKREEADCLATGGDRYDALLDDFEPGATAAEVAALFDRLRPSLVALAGRIAGSSVDPAPLVGSFPAAEQLDLARGVAGVFGYDWAAGRLDLAVHPSSTGTGGDVRITTRVDPDDPFSCLHATIHEVGHAVYEQGLDPDLAFQPVGAYASMGVHESQSRLFENHFGRSRTFCAWLAPAMSGAFGRRFTAEELHAACNRIERGFIRTEADEVHYSLHVMLRFDLERDLIAGRLEVTDLDAAWNARFLADFGRPVPDARRGVLQDVHWSSGAFGYFPTYTLGTIYAAELDAALRREVDVDACLAAGQLQPAIAWLNQRIHRHGRLLPARELIGAAIGRPPDEAALVDYLEVKFGALYALGPPAAP